MGKVSINLEDKLYMIINSLSNVKKKELINEALKKFLENEDNLKKFFDGERLKYVQFILKDETKKIPNEIEEGNSNQKENNSKNETQKAKVMWDD